MFHHKHIPLLISFALPVVMIIVIALSIFLPQYISHPKYDFVYSVYDGYYSTSFYTLEKGKLVQNLVPVYELENNYYRVPKLYRYDMQNNLTKEISFGEAQQYMYFSSEISPDGYTIKESGMNGGIFPFSFDNSANTRSVYAVTKYSGKKLTIHESTTPWSNQIHFIGWIQK